jgi:hypothetical protein
LATEDVDQVLTSIDNLLDVRGLRITLVIEFIG